MFVIIYLSFCPSRGKCPYAIEKRLLATCLQNSEYKLWWSFLNAVVSNLFERMLVNLIITLPKFNSSVSLFSISSLIACSRSVICAFKSLALRTILEALQLRFWFLDFSFWYLLCYLPYIIKYRPCVQESQYMMTNVRSNSLQCQRTHKPYL